MKKKEGKGAMELEWATAHFFYVESQYSKLYCDTGLDRHGLGDRPGRSACAVGPQAEPRCAPGAPDSVLTQCTIWDTVHEHCSRGLKKFIK